VPAVTNGPEARRRRIALGAVAALAALGGILVGARTGDEATRSAAEPGFCDPPRPIARVAGQGVMVRMEGRATGELIAQARAGEIGGVILFPPSEIAGEKLASELKRLQAAAREGGNPRLLVAIDQEGGIVERLPALPPQLSPYTLAQNDDRQAAVLEGRATGFQLREIGIDVNLAPVMDVPVSEDQFMAPRAFGTTPEQVRRLALAFADGQRREVVAATAKHFPGLGRAIENTDLAPTAIETSRAGLRADIAPFRAAIDRGIELIMISSATYPGLGARAPAVLSPAVATDLLRGDLGFTGVTISDDLLAPAIAAEYPRREAAVLASAAGVDVLLFAARDSPGIASGLAAAVQTGELDESRLRASCGRIVALKERLAAGESLNGG
jgi:beta-N-acetylhexosaminidase